MSSKRQILWIPHAPWEVRQRANYLVRYLAREYRVHVITWEAISSYGELINVRRLASTLGSGTIEAADGIVYHKIRQAPGGRLSPIIRKRNALNMSRAVERIVDKHKIDGLIVSSPMPVPDVGIPIVGDFIDAHSSYWRDIRRRPDIAAEVDAAEMKLAARANRHIVVSHSLGERLEALGYSSTYIPNGVDLLRVRQGDRCAFRKALGVEPGARVVGYIGAFGEFAGLIRVVESVWLWPDNVHLAIAGDGPQLAAAVKHVAKYGNRNVHFLGWLENVGDFFAGIDVGLLPFDVVDFTSMACPIKLLEYLGAGKPVVSTSLEEVVRMNLDGVTFVQASPEGIAKGVSRATEHSLAAPVNDLSIFAWEELAEEFALVVGSVIDERSILEL